MAEAASMDTTNSALTVSEGNSPLSKLRRLTSDPSVKNSMPMIFSVIAVVVGLVVYMVIQKPAVTTLYASLPDAEKARVVEALKTAAPMSALTPPREIFWCPPKIIIVQKCYWRRKACQPLCLNLMPELATFPLAPAGRWKMLKLSKPKKWNCHVRSAKLMALSPRGCIWPCLKNLSLPAPPCRQAHLSLCK